MNTTKTRHVAATVATATAVAAALTVPSQPDHHDRQRTHKPTPSPDRPQTVSEASTSCRDHRHRRGDAHRKSLLAQYYIDHALEFYQRDAR